MNAFINPPPKIPFYLKLGIWMTKKITGKDLLPPKLLAWYPKTAISSGILESLIANGKKDLDRRILKIVRLATSFAVSCPFCIDMNSLECDKFNITDKELSAIQGVIDISSVSSFNQREILAIQYARFVSQTPISIPAALMSKIKEHFTEREIVILASTVAQVNYWARLLQGLGVPPAGFTTNCTT